MTRSGDSGVFLLLFFFAVALILWVLSRVSGYIEDKIEKKSNARFDSLVRTELHKIKIFEQDAISRIKKSEEESIKKIDIQKNLLTAMQDVIKSNSTTLHDIYIKHVSEIVNGYSNYLRTKKHPAHSSAEIVDSIRDAFSRCNADLMVTRSKLAIFEDKFPDFIKEKENELVNRSKSLDEREKSVKESEIIIAKSVKNATDKKEEDLKIKELDIIKALNKINEREQSFEKIIQEKTIGFPWAAEQYANFVTFLNARDEEYLKNKRPPAVKAAEKIKEYSRIASIAEKKARTAEGLIAFYEAIVPWIVELKSAPDDIISLSTHDTTEQNIDPARKYILDGEWDSLSTTEKFQKALDRYWKRKKSNWEIGRDFERFIGYEYEVQGWDVVYFGAVKGFEDLGRDVIARNEKDVHIVQCKYWASDKIIHEKHLFQLFGTSVVYKIENNLKSYPKSVFVTSCSLSDTAKDVAKALNIEVVEKKKMTQFPCVKCNVGNSGEKIYHLPFDQQYDKIKIEKHKGEIYCATIAEAEEAGFRRAFRWKGNKS